jgi:hypothetical protein
MIAHTTTGSSFQDVLAYCSEKQDARILFQEGVSGSVSDMGFYFDMFAEQRPGLSKPVFHTSLSFDYEDNLTDEQMVQIGKDYLEQFGFKDNQYIIIRHLDTLHQHIHLIANRVEYEGGVVSDSQSYRKNWKICRELEEKYNLTLLGDRQKFEFKLKNSKLREVADYVKNALDELLSEVYSPEELQGKLAQKGIEFRFSKDEKGNLKRSSYRYDNFAFRGSQLGQGYRVADIDQRLDERRVRVQEVAFSPASFESGLNLLLNRVQSLANQVLTKRQIKGKKWSLIDVFNKFNEHSNGQTKQAEPVSHSKYKAGHQWTPKNKVENSSPIKPLSDEELIKKFTLQEIEGLLKYSINPEFKAKLTLQRNKLLRGKGIHKSRSLQNPKINNHLRMKKRDEDRNKGLGL